MRSADRLHSIPASCLSAAFRARHSAIAASTLRALALQAARSSHSSPLKHSLLHTLITPPLLADQSPQIRPFPTAFRAPAGSPATAAASAWLECSPGPPTAASSARLGVGSPPPPARSMSRAVASCPALLAVCRVSAPRLSLLRRVERLIDLQYAFAHELGRMPDCGIGHDHWVPTLCGLGQETRRMSNIAAGLLHDSAQPGCVAR